MNNRQRTSSTSDGHGAAHKYPGINRPGPVERPGTEVTVKAFKGELPDLECDISYTDLKPVGSGSFGVVYQARLVCSGASHETVAIKKVLQDKRFKNRELQIMRKLDHPNIVKLAYFFYTLGDKRDDVFLNLVLEYMPETVYRVSRHYNKTKQLIPMIHVKVYLYQLLRALAFIHSLGVCHRDIKPQNLLLDPESSVLKLCDFGSAKALVRGEPNVAYICSRYYRAPELIFGATDYTCSIDIWSTGCVLVELLIGKPIFPGDSGVDQLVEIIKVLGTPTHDQIKHMNQHYSEFKFPTIKPHPWSKMLRPNSSADTIDIVTKLLEYTPDTRLPPTDALSHPFFDELRDPSCRLPNGHLPPNLFSFSSAELAVRPGYYQRLVPNHIRKNEQPDSMASSSVRDDTRRQTPPPSSSSAFHTSP